MPKIFLLVGPSCAGKSSVQQRILAARSDFVNAKGMWTRPHRPGESDETADSLSVSGEVFARHDANGELTAMNYVHGHWYGTPKASFLEPLAQGKHVIRIVTDKGAEAVMRDLPQYEIVTIYLWVPIHLIVERLLQRGDAPEDIVRRVKTAEDELAEYRYEYVQYDYEVDASAPLDEVVSKIFQILDLELRIPTCNQDQSRGI